MKQCMILTFIVVAVLLQISVNGMDGISHEERPPAIIDDYRGQLLTLLTSFLHEQDFLLISSYLRTPTEDSLEKRIDWLLEKVAEGHDYLMWELSREYCLAKNIEESFYWYELARLRGMQDAACCNDEWSNNFIKHLSERYFMHWSSLKPSWWPFGYNHVQAQELFKERVAFMRRVRLRVIARIEDWGNYSSPLWIHGVNAKIKKMFPMVEAVKAECDEERWGQIRKKVIEEYVKKAIGANLSWPTTPTFGEFMQKHADNRRKMAS